MLDFTRLMLISTLVEVVVEVEVELGKRSSSYKKSGRKKTCLIQYSMVKKNNIYLMPILTYLLFSCEAAAIYFRKPLTHSLSF